MYSTVATLYVLLKYVGVVVVCDQSVGGGVREHALDGLCENESCGAGGPPTPDLQLVLTAHSLCCCKKPWAARPKWSGLRS